MKYFFFFFTLLFFLGCKSDCDCYSENKPGNPAIYRNPVSCKHVLEINTKVISDLLTNNQYNQYFGLHLFSKNDKYYFVFLTQQDSLIIIDFEGDKAVRKVNFKNVVKNKEYYNGLFVNDTFHLVDAWGKKYYQYKVDTNWEFKLTDSIDINDYKDFADCEIYPKLGGQGIKYQFPNILFHYGSTKKKNYIDSKAYLKINLVTKSFEKVIDYPDCYHCTFLDDNEGSSIFLSNTSILTIFNQYDKLFLTSSEANENKNFSLTHDCGFYTFDKKKIQDLAYVRRYTYTGERNLNLINIKDKFFVVIKQDAKDNLQSKGSHSLFVFDSTFKQVDEQKINHALYWPATFNYKEGFLIFNDSLNKAYYYDFKK